jgi:hypothetical protein
MNEYMIKVAFWVRAFDSTTIEASSDAEAIEKGKAAAAAVMASHAHPEAIDFDERREGSIAYIDRVDPDGREEIVNYVPFDDDRLHAQLHQFIDRLAATPSDTISTLHPHEVLRRYAALIAEATTLRTHVA